MKVLIKKKKIITLIDKNEINTMTTILIKNQKNFENEMQIQYQNKRDFENIYKNKNKNVEWKHV